ncbi:indian hedgehog protein-like isoform X1 [Pleurodeles waltl]|uniref:indian hedgehog protein-like isoform X1 n=1 Tax=Pleurodeles waltl TaxID=8319 RepID=UPI0037098B47
MADKRCPDTVRDSNRERPQSTTSGAVEIVRHSYTERPQPPTSRIEAPSKEGCFSARSLVTLEGDEKIPVSELMSGHRVLCMDADGRFTYSDFLTYLDKDCAAVTEFRVLETQNPPRRLALTASHLVFVADDLNVPPKDFCPMFASLVQPGKCILIAGADEPQPARVVSVTTHIDSGAFAPLTGHGTLIVDDVVVSCFAVVQSHHLAQLVFWPLRLYHSVGSLGVQAEGMHWYSKMLYSLGKLFLNKKEFHPIEAQGGTEASTL